jgi:F-type H+-transporting ATPase subunit gamma
MKTASGKFKAELAQERVMAAVIANLAAGMSGAADAPLLLAGNGKDQKHLIVVATSDRGLAGGFNSAVVRLAREHVARLVDQGKDVRIITIGRKGRDQLRRTHGQRLVENYELGVKAATMALVRPVAEKIIDMYEKGEVDVVTLISSRFKSVVTQTPTPRQLIPTVVDPEDAKNLAFYDYEPDEATILATLLPQNIAVQILAALLENQAGFYAAQMTAMDNATRNAGELIKTLTIQMNRTRQAQITKELIEIISGAAAV